MQELRVLTRTDELLLKQQEEVIDVVSKMAEPGIIRYRIQ